MAMRVDLQADSELLSDALEALIPDLMAGLGCSKEEARKSLRALVQAGLVEVVGDQVRLPLAMRREGRGRYAH